MQCPEVLVVVPLRLESTRLKQKVLSDIQGESLAVRTLSKTLNAFKGAQSVKVIAAVDSKTTEIHLKEKLPELEVVMTQESLSSGTDRVYAAVQLLKRDWPDMNHRLKGVINVQGDMPFMGADALREMAGIFISEDSSKLQMLTISQVWPSDIDYKNLGQVKVLMNKEKDAIYFSRHPIPFSREDFSENSKAKADLHVGIYGFTLDVLTRFCLNGPIEMEKTEGLEQLRALYLGIKIHVIQSKIKPNESYRGIDTPEDLEWARCFK